SGVPWWRPSWIEPPRLGKEARRPRRTVGARRRAATRAVGCRSGAQPGVLVGAQSAEGVDAIDENHPRNQGQRGAGSGVIDADEGQPQDKKRAAARQDLPRAPLCRRRFTSFGRLDLGRFRGAARPLTRLGCLPLLSALALTLRCLGFRLAR